MNAIEKVFINAFLYVLPCQGLLKAGAIVFGTGKENVLVDVANVSGRNGVKESTVGCVIFFEGFFPVLTVGRLKKQTVNTVSDLYLAHIGLDRGERKVCVVNHAENVVIAAKYLPADRVCGV